MRWYEESGSRSATVNRLGTKQQSTCDIKFRMTGTYDDQVVHAQAVDFFNTNRFRIIAGMTFLVKSYDISHLGGEAWEVTAHYETNGEDDPERPEPLKRGRQFDTGGGTAHISVGFAERRYGENAPDMKKVVDFDGETVKGIDIVVPALQWSETYDVPTAKVTADWIRSVSDITGCINDAAFRGFEAEEVLFLGCSGSQQWDTEKGDGPWNLQFKFTASRTQTNLKIGDIENIEKKGHDYLWMLYEDSVNGNQGFSTRVAKPKFVYTTRVYRKASFADIGIGVA
jgi:hypothetical protein